MAPIRASNKPLAQSLLYDVTLCLTCVCVCVCQDQGERPDRGGGRDQSGGGHPELRCLRPQEHVGGGEVRKTYTTHPVILYFNQP